MRYGNAVAMIVVLLAMLPVWAEEKAESRDPAKVILIINVGEKATLDLWGFFHEAFIQNAEPDEFQWTNLRLYGNLDGERFGLGFVFNFADLQEEYGDWVREFYGKVKLTNAWEARVGRILHSVGTGNARPGPFRWETALFPHLPWGQYGTGWQLKWIFGPWSAIIDATGNSSASPDDLASLRDLEFSALIKRTFADAERELGYLSGSVQLIKNVCHFGLDGQYRPIKELTLRGGLVYSDYASEKHSNSLDVFGLAAYRLTPRFEIHTMIDGTADLSKKYQELQEQTDELGITTYQWQTYRTSDAARIAWTNGLRILGEDDHWAVTLDYEMALEGQQPDRILARFQVRF